MSKECRQARNVVVLSAIILATLIMLMSSCSTGYYNCVAYDAHPGGTSGKCNK